MNYTELIDISWPISATMTAYKDNRTVQIVATKTFQQDHVRSSIITMSSHTGTHIDAPSHFLEYGASTEAIDLKTLIGPCIVIDVTHAHEYIMRSDLELHAIEPGAIVLVKTKNSNHNPQAPFDYNFVALHADAAVYLVEKKIKAFGIDYLGVERGTPGHPTHKTLLSNGVTLLESIRLGHVAAGAYTLCCLPLLLEGLDGAPARAVLLR